MEGITHGRVVERVWTGAAGRFLIGVLISLLSTLALLGIGAVAWQQRYAGRIIPGVWVAGIPLQGLTAPEAEAALRQAWDEVGPRHLTLRDGDRQWVLPLEDLGISWDVQATVRAAMAIGHSGSFGADWRARLTTMRRGVAAPALWAFDLGQANLALRRLAQEIDQPPRSATLDLSGAAPQSAPAVYGRELDVQATGERLAQAVAGGLPQALDLAIVSIAPTVVGGEEARQHAEQLLSRRITLTMDDDGTQQAWTLGRELIRSAIKPRQEVDGDGLTRWTIDLDAAPIAQWLSNVARQVDRPLIEGRVRLDAATLHPSVGLAGQSGRQVDTAAALERVLAALDGGSETLELPVEVTLPYVTPERVAGWGQLHELSEGVSYFKGSDPGRKQNIVVGSAVFHGVVVPPGETFSFIEHLTPVTAAEGWAEAYVIVGDRTELGAGGGICQVSTTAFRAAFFGGFPMVTRYPHPYRVGWYEPPVGLDATVFTPWTDFTFRNDLEMPIIIQTFADTSAGVLTFKFYGPEPLQRTVEMEGPYTDRHTPAPPPIYEDDPDLEPGQVIKVDSAHDGLRARVYRIIKEGDKVIAREEFVSNYRAWPARYKRGPQPEGS